jgi:ferredoxin
VQLASSGQILQVPADRSVAQVLEANGIALAISYEQGVCGTCVTRILEGQPDHRDMLALDGNEEFTPCCSRSLSARLVLDLKRRNRSTARRLEDTTRSDRNYGDTGTVNSDPNSRRSCRYYASLRARLASPSFLMKTGPIRPRRIPLRHGWARKLLASAGRARRVYRGRIKRFERG